MRKTIIALLSIIMCVTLLAACGTSTATVDNGDKKNENNENGEEMSEAMKKFYADLDYDVFGENDFAGITPLAAISFNIDTEKYYALPSEYKEGDTIYSIRLTQNGKLGSVILEYDKNFVPYEGATEEEITINGMKAVMGTMPGEETWSYISFLGEYEGFHIENMFAEWLPSDNEELMSILNDSLILVKYN
ncbi:MAG: hypothetical protein IKX99_05680 [Lachnospiraceae bacterium]|nr:hypothetical protein [Lachnospiraceae bacterium]